MSLLKQRFAKLNARADAFKYEFGATAPLDFKRNEILFERQYISSRHCGDDDDIFMSLLYPIFLIMSTVFSLNN
ncbi:MAG: hypothetical protein LUH08_01150 [Ruminococcus sp.]|nr:hypothetical protein [Ruminococcus sp.]